MQDNLLSNAQFISSEIVVGSTEIFSDANADDLLRKYTPPIKNFKVPGDTLLLAYKKDLCW